MRAGCTDGALKDAEEGARRTWFVLCCGSERSSDTVIVVLVFLVWFVGEVSGVCAALAEITHSNAEDGLSAHSGSAPSSTKCVIRSR